MLMKMCKSVWIAMLHRGMQVTLYCVKAYMYQGTVNRIVQLYTGFSPEQQIRLVLVKNLSFCC